MYRILILKISCRKLNTFLFMKRIHDANTGKIPAHRIYINNVCEACKENFTTLEGLKRHFELIHSNSQFGAKIVRCNKCHHYLNIIDLVSHNEKMHNEEISILNEENLNLNENSQKKSTNQNRSLLKSSNQNFIPMGPETKKFVEKILSRNSEETQISKSVKKNPEHDYAFDAKNIEELILKEVNKNNSGINYNDFLNIEVIENKENFNKKIQQKEKSEKNLQEIVNLCPKTGSFLLEDNADVHKTEPGRIKLYEVQKIYSKKEFQSKGKQFMHPQIISHFC